MCAGVALKTFEGFVADFQALQIHDANKFITAFPGLPLFEFHAGTVGLNTARGYRQICKEAGDLLSLFVTRPQRCPRPCISVGHKSAPRSSVSRSAHRIPACAGLNHRGPNKPETQMRSEFGMDLNRVFDIPG
jgi:hypothetical protein